MNRRRAADAHDSRPFVAPHRGLCVGLALASCLGADLVRAQQTTDAACALSVKTDNTRTSYQKRDYGCEGIYVGLQSAPLNVQVVSLVRGPFELDQDVASLVIRTSPPAELDRDFSLRTRVLGRAREANLNWAMDGFAKADSPMVWNLRAVVHPLALTGDQIGVTGLRERQSGLAGPMFVPVAITAAGAPLPHQAPIGMIVRIPAASAVQWRLSPDDAWIVAEDVHATDGYFGIALPAGPPAMLRVLVRWRARGTPSWGETERLSVYRW